MERELANKQFRRTRIESDTQLKDFTIPFPGDDDETDVQMQGGNHRHPIEDSAETVLCNLLRNTARQVMQENDLRHPIRGGGLPWYRAMEH